MLRAMRWLALDIGAGRVGVATCDESETVVTPLRPLVYRGPEATAEAVVARVAESGATAVVVGVPVTRSGFGRGMRRIDAFLAALKARLELPIATVDERGTTREAAAMLMRAGVTGRRRDAALDSTAAQVILERHLARRRAAGAPRR
jgi:putative Holliday junction resolvase